MKPPSPYAHTQPEVPHVAVMLADVCARGGEIVDHRLLHVAAGQERKENKEEFDRQLNDVAEAPVLTRSRRHFRRANFFLTKFSNESIRQLL